MQRRALVLASLLVSAAAGGSSNPASGKPEAAVCEPAARKRTSSRCLAGTSGPARHTSVCGGHVARGCIGAGREQRHMRDPYPLRTADLRAVLAEEVLHLRFLRELLLGGLLEALLEVEPCELVLTIAKELWRAVKSLALGRSGKDLHPHDLLEHVTPRRDLRSSL